MITPQVAMDMNMMMSKVVEEGTARRAIIEGVRAAGKTGTTNAHRDAWFVGYTGNFICGIWFGNDDYSTMHQMTGGSLPAMTWKEIVAYAHQGVELKQIPGLGPDKPASGRAPVAEGKRDGTSEVGDRPPVGPDQARGRRPGPRRAVDGRCHARAGDPRRAEQSYGRAGRGAATSRQFRIRV